MDDAALSALTAALGPLVRTDAEILAERSHDYWAVSHLKAWRGETLTAPGCVVQPTEVAHVQTAIRIAAERGIAVVPFGLGSGVVGGILPTPDVVMIDLSRMNRTVSIDEHDLLATFEAGKNGMEAEDEVAALGLTIGHWPQSIALSSVGGWISTRASGQFSTAYGNIEDIVYSFDAVLPNGEFVTLGKAPRAAAGPDLRHLLMGAEGTMGIVTGVTLSLRRQPEARRYTAFFADAMPQGIEAQRRILHADWRPPVMRQYDHPEVALKFGDFADAASAMLLLVHEGPAGRVDAEVADIRRIAADAGLREAPEGIGEHWMGTRNHVSPWTALFERGVVADTVEISAAWSRIDAIYDAVLASLGEVEGIRMASAHSSHAYRSGVNYYFTFAVAAAPEDMEDRYLECWRRVMEAVAAHGGGVAHHHGAGRLRKPYIASDLGAAGVELLRTIKAALDPTGIMNPGNLIPDPAA